MVIVSLYRDLLTPTKVVIIRDSYDMLSSDRALSSPKLQLFIVLVSYNKYMHLIADLTDAVDHSKFVFIQLSITR